TKQTRPHDADQPNQHHDQHAQETDNDATRRSSSPSDSSRSSTANDSAAPKAETPRQEHHGSNSHQGVNQNRATDPAPSARTKRPTQRANKNHPADAPAKPILHSSTTAPSHGTRAHAASRQYPPTTKRPQNHQAPALETARPQQ